MEVLPMEEESRSAMWSCDPSKALKVDAFNLNFIRKCWDTIGGDFSSCVLNFFFFFSPRKLNMTWITLILKFEEAQEIKDYKPISTVGYVYKVIAKVLANRIRNVRGGLVGET